MQENITNPHRTAEPLEAFGRIANQLHQDVQERLVFRANLYFHSDILNYKPSAGDLAYPEKLEMMEVCWWHIGREREVYCFLLNNFWLITEHCYFFARTDVSAI